MKKITLLFLVFLPQFFYAQAPSLQWQKCLGGTDTDNVTCIQQTSDGGYITTGYTRSTDFDALGNHGAQDILVVKLTTAGTVEWKKTFGGTSFDTANSIQQTSDGGYILAGNTYSTDGNVTGNHGNMDAWVLKLNASGDLLWQKALGGSSQDNANDIKETADGGFIVACDIFSSNGNITSNHGTTDAWLVKLNAAGTIVWQKSYGGTKADIARSIQQTVDGGYVFTGYTNSNDGDVTGNHSTTTTDAWVVKTNATGTIQWQKTLGGTNVEEAYSIQQTTEGGFILCGKTSSNDGDVTDFKGWSDYWIVKLNAVGTIIWQKTYGGTGEDIPFSIKQTIEGGYVVTGYTNSEDGDVDFNHAINIATNDIWVLHLDTTGFLQWQISLGNQGYQDSYGIQQTADGGFVVAGNTGGAIQAGEVTDFIGGNLDFWIVKLSSSPLTTTSFNSKKLKVYPNPATATLYFNWIASKIKIYDLQGRIVKVVADSVRKINVVDLTSGTYFLETTTTTQEVQRIKFIKI